MADGVSTLRMGGVNMGLSGVITLTGGTFNGRIVSLDAVQQVSPLEFLKSNATSLTYQEHGVGGSYRFTAVVQNANNTGLNSVGGSSGRGTVTWAIGNGETLSSPCILLNLRVRRPSGTADATISGLLAFTTAIPGSQTAVALINSTLNFSAERSLKYSDVAYLVEACSSDPRTLTNLKTIADALAAANPSSSGIPYLTYSSRAINATTAFITLHYRYRDVGFYVPTHSKPHAVPGIMQWRQWTNNQITSYTWHDGSAGTGGPADGNPGIVHIPYIDYIYVEALASDPENTYAAHIGKINSDATWEFADVTLNTMFLGYDLFYVPEETLWYTRFKWRKLPLFRWTRDKLAFQIYQGGFDPDEYGLGDITNAVTRVQAHTSYAFATLFAALNIDY